MRDTDEHHWLKHGTTSSIEVRKIYDDWADADAYEEFAARGVALGD